MSSAVLGDITGDRIAEVLVGSPYAYYFADTIRMMVQQLSKIGMVRCYLM